MYSIVPQATRSVTPQVGRSGFVAPIGVMLTVIFSILLPTADACHAGGGPENVFLLVNSTSEDSMTVANHYIDLRKIPSTNVLYIPYTGSAGEVSGGVLRNQILKPAFDAIKERKLASQIDYLVYSCDFPWRIFFASDFPDEKLPTHYAPRGSLTGLTYLHAFVEQKRKEVVSLNTNWYFTEPQHGVTISRAFRSQYRWAASGRRTGAQGLSYMISSMLGVTNEKSNTVPEIISSLERSKEADGTKPPGTVYFYKHSGPRSKPRHDQFQSAATELRRLGVTARVEEGLFPENKRNIAGLTCGVAYAELGAAQCRFLPGAFCDNLTSFGAMFPKRKPTFDPKTGEKRRNQVSVADFIRYGATAASGTVFEPLAIKQKFPSPFIHVHYAGGCSLGEAFYQSVSGPYQQLLVGDPLCQPWASIPQVEVEGIKGSSFLRGEVELTPTIDPATAPAGVGDEPAGIQRFELFVDGQRRAQCRSGEKLKLDTTTLTDGHHELRVVATVDTPIETQGRLIADVTIKNGKDAIALSTSQTNVSTSDDMLTLNVISTSSQLTEIVFNGQKLAQVPTGSGQVKIKIDQLGAGPVELFAVSDKLRSQPLRVKIGR